MTAQNRADLKTKIATDLANNTSGLITPTLLRGVLDNMVDGAWNVLNESTLQTAAQVTTTVNAAVSGLQNAAQVTAAVNARTESFILAASDETTDLTTGTAKVTFRMPYALTLTAVRASVGTAPTGSTLVVDINEGGTSILSTKLSIDAGEKTSTTAATPPVISDTALADDAEITIDIDQIGSSVAGAGLKVYLIGTRV